MCKHTIPNTKILIQIHWRKWYPTLTTMSMIVCYRPISYLYEDVSSGTLVWSVHEEGSIIIIISQRQPLTIFTRKILNNQDRTKKKRRRKRVNRVENATKKYSCKPQIESKLVWHSGKRKSCWESSQGNRKRAKRKSGWERSQGNRKLTKKNSF